ncbi:TPA: hypothetical protein QDZ99_004018 [Stenotrophomonas maltophilia]|nr:hypothetical protein [Stenotrophomonas maltophilia]HDS1156811.1 hypothetical protein [Stenotrophomonas maltophilia]HDS1163531.1 hypothetical protein [Stenotrophomonas maltophilia]HDS1172270.1 hypothetical protein [Stenotrophomonas maltophilia]HDS1176956.1 hypothetical protein [Stenotrophomonas maltophilia]
MAWKTGTAANVNDLLLQLRDFLTSDSALVAANQNWEVVGGVASGPIAANNFVSLKGKGLAGADEIYLSLQSYTAPSNSHYTLALRGHTAYNPASPSIDPAGANSSYVGMPLVNSAFVYWFIANGRCFKVVTRINGRYDALYAGLILPEHLPEDWSYPLFIGASSYNRQNLASDDSNVHSNFWNPSGSGASNTSLTQAYLFSPMQAWVPLRNTMNSSYAIQMTGRLITPWAPICNSNHRRLLDGTAWLQRGQMLAVAYAAGNPDIGSPSDQVPEGGQFYGGFDGVFYTPSLGAVAEQRVTAGGIEHLLVPNVYRTGDGQFAAFALE